MQAITSQQLFSISLKALQRAIERQLVRYSIRSSEKALQAHLATRKEECERFRAFLTDSTEVEIEIGKEIVNLKHQLDQLKQSQR